MKNDSKLPVLYTSKDIAHIFGRSESSARELMRSEDFPSFKIKDRHLIEESRFFDWMRKQESEK